MKQILLGAFMLVVPSLASASDASLEYETNVPTLYGYLLYDAETFTSDGGPYGIYSMDVTPEVKINPVNLDVTANGGGCYAEGKYYAIHYTSKYGSINSCKLVTYDASTWAELSSVDASQKCIATTMTYNPADKQIYGCFFDNEADKFILGTLDVATAAPQQIKVLDVAYRALAADADGTIYGIDENGDFYRYDASATDFVKVGPTGFIPKNIQDATFDHASRQLYWAALNNTESGIYNVDVKTGTATKVSVYPTGEKEFSTLFSTTPVYAPEQPGMVSNVQLDFAAGAVEGKLKFVMPSVSYGGSSLDGTLSYKVTVSNDGKVVDGSASAGASVEVPLSLNRGLYRLTVEVANDKGYGPAFNIRHFFGVDVPSDVTGFKAVRNNGLINLAWNAVVKGANGGLFYPDKVRYDITRQPDGVKVASGVTGTEYTDDSEVSELGSYYYEIVATDGEVSSSPVKSASVVLGKALDAPYAYNFRNRAGFGNFTVIDANGDGCTWISRDAYGVVCMYSSLNSGDDWLMSPPLKLHKGVRYEVSAAMASAMDPMYERFEMKCGVSAEPEAMKTTVIEPTLLTESFYRKPDTFTGYITPEQDGEFYVGIHCISDPDNLFLYCAEFSIKAASTVSVTDVVTGQCDISVSDGSIVVTGAEGESVEVYSMAGMCVARQMGQSTTVINVAPGLYAVKAGTKVAKIIVR